MEIVPRYEFRVWDDELESARLRLFDQGSLYERRHSSEIYVVSKAEDINVKIRAGIVDVKQLLMVRGNLERWKPVFNAAFPLDARVVATSVFARLGVDPPKSDPGGIDQDAFIEAAETLENVIVVRVRKDRSLLSLGHCRGEASRVQLDDTMLETIAVESADPTAVEAAASDLGIDERQNESYPAKIRRLRWA